MGLWWLARKALKQDCVLNVDVGPAERPGPFYSINLRSPNLVGRTGAHLRCDLRVVKRTVEDPHYDGWLYDLTTETGSFHAGVGDIVIHNSPRRGKEFVTRKISDGVARIKLGLAKELRLGNLDAHRDWGYAGDYVRAMWMMLQQSDARRLRDRDRRNAQRARLRAHRLRGRPGSVRSSRTSSSIRASSARPKSTG